MFFLQPWCAMQKSPRVQQQIKKRRRGKKVRIRFPKELLKSGKYKSMLQVCRGMVWFGWYGMVF